MVGESLITPLQVTAPHTCYFPLRWPKIHTTMGVITIRKGQWPILAANLACLSLFTAIYTSRRNYEFLIYLGVIVFFLLLILATNRKVAYPNDILWGLTAWAALHMSGGGIYLGGTKLYEIILVPVSEAYGIFRFDQFVHIVGFGVATLVMYHLIRPFLGPGPRGWGALSIVVVMAGLGVGALNEIVEFAATVAVPETGVGGYVNTSLDLVADLVGALGALALIRIKEARRWAASSTGGADPHSR
jgi:uncharacterized membrane protein YjdF